MNTTHAKVVVTNTLPAVAIPAAVKNYWTHALRAATLQGANARLANFHEDINPYKEADLKAAFHNGYTFVYKFI